MNVAAEIASALGADRRRGNEYVCRCPLADEHSHGDKTPSLSVSERNGLVVVHCHSRHAKEQGRVIDALKARCLWPDHSERRGQSGSRQKPSHASSTIRKRENGDEFEHVAVIPADIEKSSVAAKRLYPALCQKFGRAEVAPYQNQDAVPLFEVFRFEREDAVGKEKEIRPLSVWRNRKTGEVAWRPWWPPSPLPLYGLELLAQHPELPVLLVEGELKAEKARELLAGSHLVLSVSSGAGSVDRVISARLSIDRSFAGLTTTRRGIER